MTAIRCCKMSQNDTVCQTKVSQQYPKKSAIIKNMIWDTFLCIRMFIIGKLKMKLSLNQGLVYKCEFNKKPELTRDNKVIFTSNSLQRDYSITDTHNNAPTGFGLKVTKKSKVYFIQKKIKGTLFKRTVGKVRDFTTIDVARDKARVLVSDYIQRNENPAHSYSRQRAEELTLSQAFEKYTHHLTNRAKPATKNTMKGVSKAIGKLDKLLATRLKELTADLILKKFDSIAKETRTSAEQVFRVAHTAAQHAIELELNDAQTQGRLPALTYNPFRILQIKQKYRSKAQLEIDYSAKGVRNPLNPDTQMKAWLNAIWLKRNTNRTGADFLLLLTLWGNRKSEVYKLKWKDLITEDDARTTSYIDLDNRLAFFYDTKNHTNQTIPITDCALELLKQRKDLREETENKNRVSVFPAKSKYSKIGHYSDSKEILKTIKATAGIQHKFGHHDLRRTFGRVVEDLSLPYSATKRLLNHSALSNPTTRYTEISWERLVEYMARIEAKFLSFSPEVHNALKPIKVE